MSFLFNTRLDPYFYSNHLQEYLQTKASKMLNKTSQRDISNNNSRSKSTI